MTFYFRGEGKGEGWIWVYTRVYSGQGGRRAGGGGSRKLCEWREEEEWRPVGTIHNSTVVDTTSNPPTNSPTQLAQYLSSNLLIPVVSFQSLYISQRKGFLKFKVRLRGIKWVKHGPVKHESPATCHPAALLSAQNQ